MEKSINLIKNLYTSYEAKEIVLDLFNHKINFLKRKIFSLDELGHKVPERLSARIVQLERDRNELQEYFDKVSPELYLEIDCLLRIKELDKVSA
ncbi:MAG: hypothetical protein ACPF8V_04540 [Luteibaculum sp.]